MSNIKFMKHYVTSGTAKARVFYVASRVKSTGEACVTLIAKSFEDGRILGQMFASLYENKTDTMTDYFDNGRVRIVVGTDLYESAKARCA